MATLADYPDDWEEIFLSTPNFSMVEYTTKVDEYQRLLKERQDAADASGMSGGSEGHGVRSDHLYDKDGNPKGWGGGAFSPTEMSTGEPEEVAKTYDQWGKEVDQGDRKWGIAFNKALPNLTKGGLFGIVNSINASINKNKNQTAATSTDTTGTTTTTALPTLATGLLGYNLGEQGPVGTTASGTTANPVSAEQGILDMMRQAVEQNALDVDLDADFSANQGFYE